MIIGFSTIILENRYTHLSQEIRRLTKAYIFCVAIYQSYHFLVIIYYMGICIGLHKAGAT